MKIRKKSRMLLCALTGILALAGASIPAVSTKAAEVYSVEVIPCYQHPVTGIEEDTGHNPGLGQAMCEAQVQTSGLIEVEDDGSIWLTTRWNMVDTQTNVSFNIQTWGDSGWTPVSYEVVRQVQDEYVVTDFRIQLNTLDDIVRATNYVEPMGREVIFYYYLQNLTYGAGDFETNITSANVDTLVETMQAAQTQMSGSGTTTTVTAKTEENNAESTEEKKTISTKEAKTTSTADELLNSATGIDGEKSTTASDNASGGNVNMAALTAATAGGAAAGAFLGGGIVALLFAGWINKQKKKDEVYQKFDATGDEH